MAHTKAQGSSSNGRDSHGQRLGIKRYGSQFVNAGEIIVRQRGTKFLPGTNVTRSSDDSLFARVAGIVTFEWVTRGKKQVSVYPKETVDEYIDRVSMFIESSGKEYKSHYAVLLSWMRRDGVRTNKEAERKVLT